MYINVNTEESMKQTICQFLNIKTDKLYEILEIAKKESCIEKCTDTDKFNDIINQFIDYNISNKDINEVLFFHLGRRLNSVDIFNEGKNLFDLLSTKNEMSMFLKKYQVTFQINKNHLDLYYKGKLMTLSNKESYLRLRLGQADDYIDYSFNGFLFKEIPYENSYAHGLYEGPEFITRLAIFLNDDNIEKDYFKNSKYYQFEYLIPIDKVCFDGEGELSNKEKQKCLLNKVFYRLHQYRVKDIRDTSDGDNQIIRLYDDDTMDIKYFVAKKEITKDMLMSVNNNLDIYTHEY